MIQANRSSFLVPILAIAVLLLALGFAWLRVSTPSDGTRLAPDEAIWRADGVAIALRQSTPAGPRAGDVVLAIDGKSLAARAAEIFQPRQPPAYQTGQIVRYTVRRGDRVLEVPVTLAPYPSNQLLTANWGVLATLLAMESVAIFVFWRRPRDPAARLFFLSSSWIVAALTTVLAGLQVLDFATPRAFGLFWLSLGGTSLLASPVFLHLVLVWPQPHPLVVRRPWLIPLAYGGALGLGGSALLATKLGSPNALTWMATWEPIGGLVELLAGGLAIGALLTTYRYSATGSQGRAQIRWVLFGLGLAFALGLLLGALPEWLTGRPLLDRNLLALVGLPMPLSVAVAVLRYRLFDIDLLINRTLVYGGLTLAIAGTYVAVVSGVGALLQTGDNVLVSLLATVLVAILFQPVRERLQRAANRLLYGERDEPYRVLSRLGQRLESTNTSTTILPAIVDTVAQALKLPYVAIALQQRGTLVVAAAAGHPGAGDLVSLPLVFQTETVGQLVVAPRAPGEAFTPADRRLLADIAHQAGGAAYAVRLTADLQRSRESLVTAREEERRRLRRDLHDGLGPRLAGLTLRIETARNLLAHEPLADPLLTDLQEQTEAAIAEIRRLVYALRPPALDQLGLVSALREQATVCSTHGLRVVVDAPEQLPPLPAAVEVAAYRIALEALTNVVRHAQAHTCCIRLTLVDALQLEITDDGRGFPLAARAGVGLASMQERAAELGGTWRIDHLSGHGTRVCVRLPLAEVEA
jgi:signal transduction histidine kinase